MCSQSVCVRVCEFAFFCSLILIECELFLSLVCVSVWRTVVVTSFYVQNNDKFAVRYVTFVFVFSDIFFFYCWNHSQVIESPLFTRARLHSQTLDWCCSVSMSRSPLSPIVIEIILFHILKTRNDNKTNMKSNQNSKFTIRICMPEMYRIKTNSKYTRNE